MKQLVAMAQLSTPPSNQEQDIDACAGIFASPPEPIFNDKMFGISASQLHSSLLSLAKDNEGLMVNFHSAKNQGPFRESHRCVLFIFQLAHRLGLSPAAQYNAMELFSNFVSLHIKELYTHVKTVNQSESPISWEQVENRLKHQIILRAVSCLQIASKTDSHYNAVGLRKARTFLASCGFRYAPSSLIQSEIRVLRTIDYRVHHPTPVHFIEALLEVVGRRSNGDLPVNQLYGVCLKVMEVVYLTWETVYSSLRELCGMHSSTEEASSLENNQLFFATAVICAASFFLDVGQSDSVTQQLAETTDILLEDVLDFSSVIIEMILMPSESNV